MKTINRESYCVLLGLRKVIIEYMEIIDSLEKVGLYITDEKDDSGNFEIGGLTSTLLMGHISLDEGLKQLDIQLEKKKKVEKKDDE